MPRSSSSEIESLVADFTTQLTAVVRRSALEQVLASLGGEVAPARRGPGRPKGSKNAVRRAKGGKRTSEQVEAMGAKLLSYVKSTPGQRGEQIAKVFHTDVGTMRLPMQKLIAARKVKTKGQKRGTQYFAA